MTRGQQNHLRGPWTCCTLQDRVCRRHDLASPTRPSAASCSFLEDMACKEREDPPRMSSAHRTQNTRRSQLSTRTCPTSHICRRNELALSVSYALTPRSRRQLPCTCSSTYPQSHLPRSHTLECLYSLKEQLKGFRSYAARQH
eukprot:766727-Hanusia_phi.AAC.2